MKTLNKIIEEIDDLGQQYKFLSDKKKEEYEQRVSLLILNDVNRKYRSKVYDHWERVKDGRK